MKLLLTRPLEQSKSLKEKLEAKGFEVACLPLIEIVPPSDGGTRLKKAIQEISKYQWLVFTSQHAVRAVAKYLDTLHSALKILVIGSATAQVVKDLGWSVSGFLDSFEKEKLRNQKVLYPRSSLGLDKWVIELQNAGADVEVVEAYQTQDTKVTESARHFLSSKGVDAILFFSPSAVKAFADQQITATCLLIPFGATTAKALEEKGFKPAFIPSQADENQFVEELLVYFKSLE